MALSPVFSKVTSAAVITALVAVTVLVACCALSGASPLGGAKLVANAACDTGSHGLIGAVGVRPESPATSSVVAAIAAAGVLLGISQGRVRSTAMAAIELPPPADPRHGRIRA